MERLVGTVAVVTGGASGIGAATAERLADEGATVATVDITGGVDYVLDVRDESSVRDAAPDNHSTEEIMATQTTTQPTRARPVHEVRLGTIRASIWANKKRPRLPR